MTEGKQEARASRFIRVDYGSGYDFASDSRSGGEKSARRNRKAKNFLSEFIRQIYIENHRSHNAPHLALTRGDASINAQFSKFLLLDSNWVDEHIDEDGIFSSSLVSNSSYMFASINLSPLKKFLKANHDWQTKNFLESNLSLGSPSIASWLFLEADIQFASQICKMPYKDFEKLAVLVRVNQHMLPLVSSLLPLSTVRLSNDLIEQIEESRQAFEARFTRAQFLALHGASVADAIKWMGLSPMASMFFSVKSQTGKPKQKGLLTKELTRHVADAIRISVREGMTDPCEVIIQIINYLQLHTPTSEEQQNIKLIGRICFNEIHALTLDSAVLSMAESIAILVNKSDCKDKVKRNRNNN